MKVYIVDYLGVHCGMHYYNDAFKRQLESIPGIQVSILSNYSDTDKEPFFLDQYRGAKWKKVLSLVKNYKRFFRFVGRHKSDCIIYLTYGNIIDLPFLWIVARSSRHVIDIHEAIGQDVDSNLRLKRMLKKIYSTRIKHVISHSKRTNDFLDEFQYCEERFEVPHFKYCFRKKYDLNKVGKDIREAVDDGKINVLFFGNINYNKGVDILLSSVNDLDDKVCERLNVIVAGKDFDGTCYKIKPLEGKPIHLILRHIEDDELIFLYQHIQFLALLYRKTSQSGVLEMAFYFKRPIIANDIPYFRKILSEFPSFGILVNGSYSAAIKQAISEYIPQQFFVEEEYQKYTYRTEVEEFIRRFSNWLKK